jgi:hypothetical protein
LHVPQSMFFEQPSEIFPQLACFDAHVAGWHGLSPHRFGPLPPQYLVAGQEPQLICPPQPSGASPQSALMSWHVTGWHPVTSPLASLPASGLPASGLPPSGAVPSALPASSRLVVASVALPEQAVVRATTAPAISLAIERCMVNMIAHSTVRCELL